MFSLPIRQLCLTLLVQAALISSALAATPVSSSENLGSQEGLRYDLESDSAGASGWNVQVSVAFITESRIGDMVLGDINSADGDSAGQLYSLGVNYIAHRFEIPFRDHILTPQFEPYARLTLVDENGSSLFPDYNAGFGFRWVNFPWNNWVKTSFFMGIGLSYSSQVFHVDREKHPDEDRSHLKFDWPIQVTFALHRWPQHKLVLFNDHQSGGHIFDEGGVNSLGFGYEFEF